MSQHAAARTSQHIELRSDEALGPKVAPLDTLIDGAKEKIREELLRFRTCCADPRASK